MAAVQIDERKESIVECASCKHKHDIRNGQHSCPTMKCDKCSQDYVIGGGHNCQQQKCSFCSKALNQGSCQCQGFKQAAQKCSYCSKELNQGLCQCQGFKQAQMKKQTV